MHAMQELKLPFVFYPFVCKRHSASHVQRVLCLFRDLGTFRLLGRLPCCVIKVTLLGSHHWMAENYLKLLKF